MLLKKMPKQPKYSREQKELNDYVDVDEIGGNDYLMRFKDKSIKN